MHSLVVLVALLLLPLVSCLCPPTSLTSTTGTFGVTGTAYVPNEQCTTTLSPATSGNYQWDITFSAFNTEAGYDFVTIQAISATGTTTQIGKYAGTSIPTVTRFTASQVKILWLSDESVVKTGWTLNYVATVSSSSSTTSPPTTIPTGNCPTSSYTTRTGILMVDTAHYVDSMHCTSTIAPPLVHPDTQAPITSWWFTLDWPVLDTESGYDKTTVSIVQPNGVAKTYPVLSGKPTNATINTSVPRIINAKSVTIKFDTDVGNPRVFLGWNLNYATYVDQPSNFNPNTDKFWNTLDTREQFVAMTNNVGGVIAGRSCKFLIDQRTSTKKIYFLNMNYKDSTGKTPDYVVYHYDFAKQVIQIGSTWTVASFNAATYDSQTKSFVAGTIQEYILSDGLRYGVQLYPEDVAAESTLVSIMNTVVAAFKLSNVKIHFVATGPKQICTSNNVQSIKNIRSPYTDYTTIDQILGDIQFLPMQLGTTYGYLRIFPQDNRLLAPMDIPVFAELPLDLAVVAGTITKQYQDANSHVNLKSKERGTPNMVLRTASLDHPLLAPYNNLPVKLVITGNDWSITSATEQEVINFHAQRNNLPWISINSPTVYTLATNADMCPSDARICLNLGYGYGTKSANLGFLMSNQVLGKVNVTGTLSNKYGYDLVPDGFGIPIAWYHDFVNHPKNADLKGNLTELINNELNGLNTPAMRAEQSAKVQRLFYDGYLNATFLANVMAKIKETLPSDVKKVKIRSSANAEDLPNFDGAGLHDSFSATLSKKDLANFSCNVVPDKDTLPGTAAVDTKWDVEPKTVQCAIKAVYASLWNIRAIAERSYARLNHTTAGMGIGVVAKYDTEAPVRANSVVISRIVGSNGVYGYSFSNQDGNNLVTNPTPGTLSEQIMALFIDNNGPYSFSVTRYAKPNASEPQWVAPRTVYTEQQMVQLLEISRTVEIAYCRAKQGAYYSGSCSYVTTDTAKPKAIDMEFKFIDTIPPQWVAKQLREFGGGAPANTAGIRLTEIADEDLMIPDDMVPASSTTSNGVTIPMIVGISVGISVLLIATVMVFMRYRASQSKSLNDMKTHVDSNQNTIEMNNYMENPAIQQA